MQPNYGSSSSRSLPPPPAMLDVARVSRERNPIAEHLEKARVNSFWSRQLHEMGTNPDVCKSHSFPLSRIKRAMKASEDIKMVTSEAPVVISKGVELFVLELTIRAWCRAVGENRQFIKMTDVASAIAMTKEYNILGKKIPWDEVKDKLFLNKSASQKRLNFISKL